MPNNLNDIVQVNVKISSPAVDSANFDNLLILGPAPKAQLANPLPTVSIYSDLSELVEAGYVAIGEDADPVGIAARIAFSQNPRPARIFVGTLLEDGTLAETLEAINEVTGWYVLCTAGIDKSEYQMIAEWTEVQTKQFAYTFLTQEDPVDKIFFRSHGWCGLVNDNDEIEDIPQSNHYVHIAAIAKCLAFPSGSETWNLQTVAGVVPSQLSSTLRRNLIDNNSNFISRNAGRIVTRNGRTRGGEWIDVIRGRDWLENDMQLRIFNLLLTLPKVPFTDAGIALVQNAMIDSLKSARDRGIVAHDEYDVDGNLIVGFTTSVPLAASLTQTQRASRILTDCVFTARLAGAIHVVIANGTLTY